MVGITIKIPKKIVKTKIVHGRCRANRANKKLVFSLEKERFKILFWETKIPRGREVFPKQLFIFKGEDWGWKEIEISGYWGLSEHTNEWHVETSYFAEPRAVVQLAALARVAGLVVMEDPNRLNAIIKSKKVYGKEATYENH